MKEPHGAGGCIRRCFVGYCLDKSLPVLLNVFFEPSRFGIALAMWLNVAVGFNPRNFNKSCSRRVSDG